MARDELRGVGARAWAPAALLIFIQLLGGMRNLPQVAFFVIYLEEELRLAPVMISAVVSGAQVAGMIAALMGGMIAGRLGSRGALAAGMALSALGSLAFQAGRPWLAAALWFLGGAGLALVTVGGASYLTRISAPGAVGLLASLYALSTTAGGAVGNPLAGVLIERYGFTAFSWAGVAISVLGIAVALSMAPLSDRPARPASPRSFGFGMLETAAQPAVKLLAAMRCLPTIFYGVLTVLIPLLLNGLTGSKVLVAAYGTTLLVAASAAQLLAGRAADRFGARVPSLAAYALLALSGLALAAWGGAAWGLFAFGVLGNAAAWALATLMYVWVNDGVDKHDHPTTFGLLHAVWSVSMIGGSVLAGAFAEGMPWAAFLLAGGANLAALLLVQAYYEGKKG